MQSEIGICFEERNATSQVQTQAQAQAHKNMLLYNVQTILLRQSEHSMKINATPVPINDKWDFLIRLNIEFGTN